MLTSVANFFILLPRGEAALNLSFKEEKIFLLKEEKTILFVWHRLILHITSMYFIPDICIGVTRDCLEGKYLSH